jgi:hypothetical protein
MKKGARLDMHTHTYSCIHTYIHIHTTWTFAAYGRTSHAYIRIHTHIYTHIHAHIHTHNVHICSLRLCITYTSTYTHTHIHAHMHTTCIFAASGHASRMRTYAYLHMHTYIHAHIHTPRTHLQLQAMRQAWVDDDDDDKKKQDHKPKPSRDKHQKCSDVTSSRAQDSDSVTDISSKVENSDSRHSPDARSKFASNADFKRAVPGVRSKQHSSDLQVAEDVVQRDLKSRNDDTARLQTGRDSNPSATHDKGYSRAKQSVRLETALAPQDYGTGDGRGLGASKAYKGLPSRVHFETAGKGDPRGAVHGGLEDFEYREGDEE